MSRPVPADTGINNGGADLTIAVNQSLANSYFNVGTFTVNNGVTLTITATNWQVKANTISMLGSITADAIVSDNTGVGGNGTGSCTTFGRGDGGGGSYGGSGTSGGQGAGGIGGSFGITYGSASDLTTIEAGSAGGSGTCGGSIGLGGGSIYLYASGNITISGNISSNGGSAGFVTHAFNGAGSGGGITINGSSISINSGTISATGGIVSGSGGTGNGGGGRLKVVADSVLTNNGSVNVGNGSCYYTILSSSIRPIPTNSGTDNGGADLTIAADQSTSTSFFNVGTFTVNAGVTLTITATSVWQIKANTINILGNIVADNIITGGSGAGGNASGSCSLSDAGGGGGSYGGAGATGGSGSDCSGGVAGATYGSALDLTSIQTGSQGGSGNSAGGGAGGDGIYLFASGNITISGNITAKGGSGPGTAGGGGGGGSGGGIFLNGSIVTINAGNTIDVSGGGGVSGGGSGGGGRIKIAYTTLTNNGTIRGTCGSAPTNGTFFTQQFAAPTVAKKKLNQDLMWRFLNGVGDVRDGPWYI